MTAIEIEELARRLAGFTVDGGKGHRGRLVGYTNDRFLVEDPKSLTSSWAYPGMRFLVHGARGGWAVESVAFVPNVDVWQAGGCVCCGGGERGVKPLAHVSCWVRLTEDEKGFIRSVTYRNPHRAAGPLDRLYRFLAGLQLQDQPTAVQREAAALLHEIEPLLRNEKGTL